MCALCGALGMEAHWADKDRDSPSRRGERRVRLRLLNRILRHYGMGARLWGSGYLLDRGGGPSVRAENLSSLWLEVERASGRRCDPLDATLVAALTSEGASES